MQTLEAKISGPQEEKGNLKKKKEIRDCQSTYRVNATPK